MFTVKLDINTLFTPKATHSVAILMIPSATRFLLTSEFTMSLVLICKATRLGFLKVVFSDGGGGSQFDPPLHVSRRSYPTSIKLYTIVKQSV